VGCVHAQKAIQLKVRLQINFIMILAENLIFALRRIFPRAVSISIATAHSSSEQNIFSISLNFNDSTIFRATTPGVPAFNSH
jgi:hypothetical protein